MVAKTAALFEEGLFMLNYTKSIIHSRSISLTNELVSWVGV